MKVCSKCGRNVFDGDAVCGNCGEPVPVDAPEGSVPKAREYNALTTGGVMVLWVCIFSCLYFLWTGFDFFMRNQTGLLDILIGVGVLAVGITVYGLVGLAVSVANDVHVELSHLNEKTGVHTRLLAAVANTAATK